MEEKTDLTKWKLLVERGRQVWVYDPQQKPEDQKFWEKYFLGLDIVHFYPEFLLFFSVVMIKICLERGSSTFAKAK
jgi:hypothetical protein